MTTSAPSDTCPVGRAASVMGDRWSLLIVRDVMDGLHRFGDLQRNLGVARNILTDRLRRLVEAGVLATEPVAEGSAYQQYRLTDQGAQLFPLIVALRQWGEAHLFAPDEPHSVLVDAATGQAIAPMQPTSQQGAVLQAASTLVQRPAT